MSERLVMKDDIMFKAFFSKHEKYLKSFLSAILGEKIEIDRVTHDARLEQLTKEMKYGILDLDIVLKSGETINVEMQLKDYNNIEERTLFYASKKIVEQIEPRQDYKELKKVIVIAILDYNLTSLPEYVTETVRVASKHRKYELNNGVKYYYIELEKFRNQNPNMDEKLNQWLAFIDMERGDLLEMAKKKNKEIKQALEGYEILTGDDEVKRLAEIRLMSTLEEKSALATAQDKGTKIGIDKGKKIGIEKGKKIGIEKGKKIGIEKGKKIGIEKGKKIGKEEANKESAVKMLKLNIPIEQIVEVTGLTKEEIENLK